MKKTITLYLIFTFLPLFFSAQSNMVGNISVNNSIKFEEHNSTSTPKITDDDNNVFQAVTENEPEPLLKTDSQDNKELSKDTSEDSSELQETTEKETNNEISVEEEFITDTLPDNATSKTDATTEQSKKAESTNNEEELEETTEDKAEQGVNATDMSSQEDSNGKLTESEPEIEEPIKIPLSLASEEILAREDVEKFRKQYMTPRWSSLLYSYLESAMEYRLYVRQQIQERELPEVLEYLPVVESNYKTTAKSYSGAVGMWQFMKNSVYPFLTLNDFVDQRLDPWYSTDAGLSKLEDNYKTFGDWLIAIAAYNCGGGAMKKAIKAAGVADYWYLADNGYLPQQTADYIPKLLAIADLAINHEYYGIDLPNHNEEFEILENEKNGIFDYITVNKAYSINQLATELRIEKDIMERLNASYTMGITHPTKESKIRLPLGLAESAEEAIKNITPIDYPFKYKVVSGDSLWSISRKYNVTVNEICELNNIRKNDVLSIGKVLYIPSK